MSSNFNFYVNRQGVQGQRGAKGEQGFSPVISVESQTANEYILRVENEDGSFLSPNLRGNAIENSGGTYIRFNPETEQMYTGYMDAATTEQAGAVRMGTYEDLVAGGSEDLVPNVADVHDFVQNSIGDISGFVTTEQFNTYTSNTAITLNNLSNNKLDTSTFDSFANSTSSALSTLDTEKLDFTDLANSLVEGSNITLTKDTVNKTITISSSGAPQVQANWNEADSTSPSFIQNKPTLGTMAGEAASDYTPTADLAEVATTGDYSDLTNKPTIPAAANNATITITQGGVLKGSFTTDQATNATIDVDSGSSITVDSAISSTSENPVQNRVISSALDNKQGVLVSGTNIKTINNTSILGSGNITTGNVSSSTVTNIVQLTQADYDALTTKDANTQYMITDAPPIALADLSNVNNSAKVLMSRMSMPSNKYVDLTLGASGSTYTAPANGYISLRYNTTGATCYCHVYDPSTGFGTTKFYTQSGLNGMIQNIEVRGGSTFAVLYAGVNVLMFRFIYAVGSESEAN